MSTGSGGAAGTAADEGWLLRRVAKGDRAAFDQLYRQTAPWLAVRLRRRCRDEHLVAEVLQDTFLSIWRAAGAYVGSAVDGSAAGWMWTIAAHRLVDAFRRQARRPETADLSLAVEPLVPGADEEALAGTVGDELGVALHALPPELREVLQAMVLDGLSVRDTATLLGVPEGTVKTRARRARIAMREALS